MIAMHVRRNFGVFRP